MQKRDFLLHWLIRTAPTTDKDIADRLTQGERIYAAFEARYPLKETKPTGPHQRTHHVASLDERQKTAFEQFWNAYDWKHGKNEAAGVWKILDPDRSMVERIVAAARAEAARWRDNPPQGQTRIYAQGWLSARRWEDYTPPKAAPVQAAADPAQVERVRLLNKLQSLEHMYRLRASPGLAEQIEAARNELKALDRETA
jgi:hypothetical protein